MCFPFFFRKLWWWMKVLSFLIQLFLHCFPGLSTKKREERKTFFAIEVCISIILATTLLNWVKFPVYPAWPPGGLAPPLSGSILILPVYPIHRDDVVWNTSSIAYLLLCHGQIGANWSNIWLQKKHDWNWSGWNNDIPDWKVTEKSTPMQWLKSHANSNHFLSHKMTLQAKRTDFAVMFSTVSFYQTRSTNRILSKIS